MGIEARKISLPLRQQIARFPPSRPEETVQVIVTLYKSPKEPILQAFRPKLRSYALDLLVESGMHRRVLVSTELTPRHVFNIIKAFSAEIQVGKIRELAEEPKVKSIEPVRIHRAHLNESTGLIGAQSAWTHDYTGEGVSVAVLDSGIDHEHRDLNGRVDVKKGRNFTDEGTQNDVMDKYFHGTHVAGTIAGNGKSLGGKYTGVAPKARILPVKVFDSQGRGTNESVVAGVQWAIQNKVDVINYSGGFSPSHLEGFADAPWVWPTEYTFEERAFNAAMGTGIVAIVSAGNEGSHGESTIGLPAISDEIISVGSITKRNKLSSFSSEGPVLRSDSVSLLDTVKTHNKTIKVKKFQKPDILAPGGEVDREELDKGGCFYKEGIVSARSKIFHDEMKSCVVDGYVKSSGTSMAAPHISGLAALMLHAAQKLGIALGPQKAYIVKNIMIRTATDLGLAKNLQGAGLISWTSISATLDKIAKNSSLLKKYKFII